MTTEVLTPADAYVISGTGPYAVPHPYQAASDLIVAVIDGEDRTVLVLDTDYTVSPDPAEEDGDVTLDASAATTHAGLTLTIVRATTIEQGWQGIAGPREKGLERQLDRLTQAVQDQTEAVGRAIKVPPGSELGTEMAEPVAGKVLRFSDDGLAIVPGASSTDIEEAAENAATAAAAASSASSSAAAAAASATAATAAVVKGVYNAREFGMGAGLGNEAETVAFEAAMTFMVANGGKLLLPKGDYTLTRDISVSNASFTIEGAGTGLTRLKRGKVGAAVFLNFVDGNDFAIRNLEINAQRSVVGDGSHALRIARGENVLVENLRVKDWTSTGIIYFDPDSDTNTYKNVRVRDCVCDAIDGGGASNGISLSNTKDGRIENCNVLDLGRLGSPGFALQLKNANTRGRIDHCYARGGFGGIAIGSVDSGPPSNTYCGGVGNILEDFTRMLRVTLSDWCDFSVHHGDMAADNGLEYAIYSQDSNYSRFHVSGLRRFEGAKLIYLGTGTGCLAEVDTFHNSPYSANIVYFHTDAIRHKVKIKGYVGTRPAFTDDLVQSNSAYENMFQLGDGVQSCARTIASGVITIRNPLITAVVVDTQGAASTDDLDTITGFWRHGQLLTISQANNSRDITLKHGTGNLFFSGSADITLNEAQETVTLMYSETVMGFVRANNGS